MNLKVPPPVGFRQPFRNKQPDFNSYQTCYCIFYGVTARKELFCDFQFYLSIKSSTGLISMNDAP